MRVAFASEHPDGNINAFSGTPYYMSHVIKTNTDAFVYIQTPSYDLQFVQGNGEYGLQQLQEVGSFLSEKLQNIQFDLVICQGSSMIPFLEIDKPIVLWHDATWFGLMQMDFDEFKKRYTLLYEWDRITLEKCSLVAFAADWVCDQTIKYYNVDSEKIYTVPFGANFEPPSQENIERYIKERNGLPCQLTFLGIDWRRKGLSIAYDVVKELNASGIQSILNVIGSNVEHISWKRKIKHYLGFQPFNGFESFQNRYHRDTNIRDVGFLDKGDHVDLNNFQKILQRTHFLLHPAEFECFGIALVEANALGVPVIATNKYGPQTIIRDGINGRLFDLDDYVKNTVRVIQDSIGNIESYQSLALNSYFEYYERLNWQVSFQKLKKLISARIGIQ